MINFFLTAIIILAFICVVTVIIGINSRKLLYPTVSVFCGVIIIALALCCVIETEPADSGELSSKAYIPVTGSENKSTETKAEEKISDKTGSKDKPRVKIKSEEESPTVNKPDDMNKTVYITKTGSKYHYSYFCSSPDFYECSLEQALARGLEPCGKCVKSIPDN